MGDRAQVLIKDEGVYLYTHWGASKLEEVVRRALERGKSRWNDPEYLARIIFCEMVKGREMELTGYGIGTKQYCDAWRIIEIDCENQKVTKIDFGKVQFKKSFEEFIKEGGG